MTANQQYHGLYYFMGLVLDVKSAGDQLVAGMPGVPPGYEVVLEPAGPDQFRSIGGPIDGSILSFIKNDDKQVTHIQVGTFDLARIYPDRLASLPVTERLLLPDFDLTPEKSEAFASLAESIFLGSAGWINFDLPFPKHEFIHYLTSLDSIIFHGSNNMEIDKFTPVRKSMELGDETGRGNVQGVYGTHDGVWAMFFAVVDREKLRGSIRNGVMYFQNSTGQQISIYNFSVNQEQLHERPFTAGALYFLPRDTFTRLKLTPESYANEWASEQPVIPLAKMRLEPADFPFIDQVSGHDDTELLRYNQISNQIFSSAVSARLSGDRFEVIIPSDAEVLDAVDEYFRLQIIMVPTAESQRTTTDAGIKLTFTSLPPAVQDMLAAQYKNLLTSE